ncbi:MAG: hypothetical protein CVU19_03385 [Betaproteobacteria bacterium HGW-Betaproteobacteria-13]|nr:MAG: hypothetical protein CVU19_03385 [Betaproteobacteria bacterium HGW-Betaproteobacteria-13]
MAELTPQDMAAKLMASGFERSGPTASTLSDPIADTPTVVTLEQLRPYDHDPRVTRNPAYEEIKASIRQRGLDAPPAITRRPGEAHYIIRNGGNTRLAILRELWSETKEERFFRIIEKARDLYEQESGGQALSQSELARRLTADGYPVQQSHISRMLDAVRYLLPAIPTVLYGGLGRHQVERLAVLRKACERTWERRELGRDVSVDFATLFQDVLALFDTQPDGFSLQRVQDELVGQMAEFLEADYDTLSLEIDDSENRQRALIREPSPASPAAPDVPAATPAQQAGASAGPIAEFPPTRTATSLALGNAQTEGVGAQPVSADRDAQRLQGHIVSPATTTERLQSIQRLVADQMGDTRPDFEANALRAIPVQVGGLYPISDVWYIEPGLDMPDRLRVHIAQFAREIAEEATVAEYIEPSERGIGFICVATAICQTKEFPALARAVLTLLHALSAPRAAAPGLDRERLANDLAPLLRGDGTSVRLSDAGLVKLFRLLRLARRLLDLEAGGASVVSGHEP